MTAIYCLIYQVLTKLELLLHLLAFISSIEARTEVHETQDVKLG